jgi:hypothetical protein
MHVSQQVLAFRGIVQRLCRGALLQALNCQEAERRCKGLLCLEARVPAGRMPYRSGGARQWTAAESKGSSCMESGIWPTAGRSPGPSSGMQSANDALVGPALMLVCNLSELPQ